MQNDIKAMQVTCKPLVIVLFLIIYSSAVVTADEYHYKNVLVGDRAATMGGAYNAVSDDSSGAYYNPAGIAFSYGDSLSGSGNAYHTTQTTYKGAIADQDWVRDSTAVLPNFFGMIKKLDGSTLAISYIIPDSIIEHQEQQYDLSKSSPTVERYYLSLHSEDRTNLVGPSLAFEIGENFTFGISLFYSYRIYRHEQNQFIVYQDGSADTSFESVLVEETAYIPKIGFQYSPFEPLFIGLTISKPTLISRSLSRNYSVIEGGDYDLFEGVYLEDKKYPTQITLGVSWYPSPALLLVADIDYFTAVDDDIQAVTNIALGGEWFINANNAFRAGFFTNNDSRPECTESSCSGAKLDMKGITFGYSSYTRTSSFTLGMVYTTGTGKAAPYDDNSIIVDLESKTVTFLFAAGYTY